MNQSRVNEATALLVVKKTRQELARRRVLYFNRHTSPEWITAPHHELIATALDAIADGRMDRLMISMPPRHGKSMMSSVLFPAFWLGRNPDKQIIHISYASSLSNEFSRKVRSLIRDSHEYHELFPEVQLDPERSRLDDWKLTAGGGFKSLGVQGGVTGHGADLMLIDDPVKEGDEQSVTTLQQIFDWYLSAARTRLHPGAAVVIVMTRWHPLDLCGRLLQLAEREAQADQWETLVLPALAGEDDPLGREPGAALWPERVSRDDLLAIQALSDRYFRALYQQDPRMSDSPMFERDDFHRATTHVDKAVWTIDLAITDNSRSDYSVAQRWHLSDDRRDLYLMAGWRKRGEWPEIKRELIALARAYPDDTFAFPKQTYELLAVQSLRDELPGIKLVQVSMPRDKVGRASYFSDFAKSGNVTVLEGEFGDQFIDEHCGFPDSAPHDDQVDGSSVMSHYYGINKTFDWLMAGEDKP